MNTHIHTYIQDMSIRAICMVLRAISQCKEASLSAVKSAVVIHLKRCLLEMPREKYTDAREIAILASGTLLLIILL